MAKQSDETKADGTKADGNTSETQEVVYLVDTSGTMIDSMPRLHQWLIADIDRLGPEDGFEIVLFNGRSLSGGRLRQATAGQRSGVRQWLTLNAAPTSVNGRSDPSAAARRAADSGADQWVLLSDDAFGRRAAPDGSDIGVEQLAELVPAEVTRVDTVQFFYPDSRRLLESVAGRWAGSFEFVGEAGESQLIPADVDAALP